MTKPIAIVLAVSIFAMPLSAQQTTVSPSNIVPNKAGFAAVELTFETILAEDSYKLYGEVRSTSQLLSITGDLIEPMMKLGVVPKEVKVLAKFLNANVEFLATSRLMFAAWPARRGIPETFVGVEMTSPVEA